MVEQTVEQRVVASGYRFKDVYRTGEDALMDALHNQVIYCEASGAPITARIVAALAACLIKPDGNVFLQRIADWQGPPLADAVPLRAAGGLHALHLAGTEPALSAIYQGEPADDAAVVRDVIDRRVSDLLPWLDGPPQTNEAGRSANFITAMSWLAGQGLPPHFECLEIGSSAGINLMLARYRYALGGSCFGPEDAAMRFAPEWRGGPAPEHQFTIASTRGCDVAPVDLADPAQALRLKAYIWPEHTIRFERMATAVTEATRQKPDIVKQNAADFVEAALAQPQKPGTTRVLMHSIVWQYVPHDQQARVSAAMAAAGERATPEAPLAWIALEANRSTHMHELSVRYWPGGETRVKLGTAHPHGAWLAALDAPEPTTWPD